MRSWLAPHSICEKLLSATLVGALWVIPVCAQDSTATKDKWDARDYLKNSECALIGTCKRVALINHAKEFRVEFRQEENLKGPAFSRYVPVRWCYESEEQQNKANAETDYVKPPDIGSKWIIFIPDAVPCDGMFSTYKGRMGHVPYTDDNFAKLMKVLKEDEKIRKLHGEK